MKSYIAFIFLLCATLFMSACGYEEQVIFDEETVMLSFLQEFFSPDFSYDDLNVYATEKMIETLQRNREPGKYQKRIWNYSDSVSCKDISFEATSEDHFQITMTLSWEDDQGERIERAVEGSIGVTFDDNGECLVNYLYLKL